MKKYRRTYTNAIQNFQVYIVPPPTNNVNTSVYSIPFSRYGRLLFVFTRILCKLLTISYEHNKNNNNIGMVFGTPVPNDDLLDNNKKNNINIIIIN